MNAAVLATSTGPTDGLVHVCGAVTLVGGAVCLVALVVLHLLPTGLSPLRDAVSRYGITRFRIGYRVQTIAMGVAAVAGAVGFEKLGLPGCRTSAVLLVVAGLARLVIGWVPMDEPGAPPTAHGRRHGLAALVAFLAITAAAFRVGTGFHQSGEWPGAAGAVTALAIAMAVALVAMGALRRLLPERHLFGAIERVFYLGALGFLLVLGAELVRVH